MEIISKTLHDETGEVIVFMKEEVTLKNGEKRIVESQCALVEGKELDALTWSNLDVEVAVEQKFNLQRGDVKTVQRRAIAVTEEVAEVIR